MPGTKPDIKKLETARDNLRAMANAIQLVIDGAGSQAEMARTMGLSPNDFSRGLRTAFAPYVRKQIAKLEDLPDVLDACMTPAENLIADILGIQRKAGYLRIIPDFDEQALWDCVRTLAEHEQRVMRLLYGRIDCVPETRIAIEKAAAELGTTIARVKQIRDKALRKMRHPSRFKQYMTFPWEARKAAENGSVYAAWPPEA